jgi:2TM domain
VNEMPRYQQAKERVEALRGFYIHALVYAIVNLGLFAINMLTSPDNLWFYWPLIGWGIGLAINGTVVFASRSFLGKDWEARQMEKELARTAPEPLPPAQDEDGAVTKGAA